MYTLEDLTSLKYGQLIEIAKKYNVYKPRSKKVYLVSKIFEAQDVNNESKENDSFCKNLPSPELNDDSRRETFTIDSPACEMILLTERKLRKKRHPKKTPMPILNEITDEIVGKNVPLSPEVGGDSRRETYTIESKGCKKSPAVDRIVKKKQQSKKKPVLKEIIEDNGTSCKNELSQELESDNRRETFTVESPGCAKSLVVEKKIQKKQQQKKNVMPVLEEMPKENTTLCKNEPSLELNNDNRRETFIIESSASETSLTVVKNAKTKHGQPKKQACETSPSIERKEKKKRRRRKKQELGTSPIKQTKKSHPQKKDTLPILDENEEDKNIISIDSGKKSDSPKRRGTFTLEVSASPKSLKREGTFNFSPQEKVETITQQKDEMLIAKQGDEITVDEENCKTPEQHETEELKSQSIKKRSFSIKDFKSFVPKTEPGKVGKMNVFERLHANISLSERRSISAKTVDKLQTPKSEKRGAPLSKKLIFTSATTPFKNQNDKKIRFSTPVKERKQQLVALRDNKVNKTPLAKRSVLNTPAITKRISKATTPVIKSLNTGTPFKARQAPNFMEIHAKKFGMMENIKDFKDRHAQRGLMLLSPPTFKQKSENSFSMKAGSNLETTNAKPASKKSMIPVAKPRANLYKNLVAKVPPSTMERIREKETKLLKGVRTNKRFQLQLASSIKNKT
ncbi:uncharacterized protein LOC106667517 isoform X1 [Cimex lectularius]|uniref:Uncharacterized protein n=1 Tax=Cimex lectularius TaxID=79782 RepID=A0A8I6SJU0_CIMLE|nr:uncharacterized protein LOC106667517 isoform X1 [Cimex lectularius]